MLPADHRMRRSVEFTATVRRGRRAGGRRLVVHLALTEVDEPVRAGFVVSRAVGGAVVRTTVKRRLRHLVADRIGRLPRGARLVVRAGPAAAGASSAELGDDLDRGLQRAVRGAARGRS